MPSLALHIIVGLAPGFARGLLHGGKNAGGPSLRASGGRPGLPRRCAATSPACDHAACGCPEAARRHSNTIRLGARCRRGCRANGLRKLSDCCGRMWSALPGSPAGRRPALCWRWSNPSLLKSPQRPSGSFYPDRVSIRELFQYLSLAFRGEQRAKCVKSRGDFTHISHCNEWRKCVEARAGIEPACKDLQSSA